MKSYGADLVQFCAFVNGEIGQHPTPPAPATTDERLLKVEAVVIRDFLTYLYGQNYTKSTTARKLATLRSFYKYLIRRGQLTS